MTQWNELADSVSIEKTITALTEHGMNAMVVESGEDAKKKVFEMLPEGAQVMNMTSVTLDTLGISNEIVESGKYDAVRNKFAKMDREKDGLEMNRLGAAPEWTVGSAHAVTEDGSVFIASNTGSQLAAYVYGAVHVIWVIGTQKIVKNADEAMKRVYEHVLPLESDRAHKAYGMPGSFVSKLLVVNKEVNKGRITIIFVKEELGF